MPPAPFGSYVTPVHPIRRLLVLGLAVAAVSACVESNRGVLEIVPGADSVQVVEGVNDTAFVRSPMPNAPAVVVKDARGFRIPNARVTFTPSSPLSGRVEGAEVRTDGNGIARPGAWIAGPDSGTDTLIAWVVGPPGARATRALITAPVIDPCGRPLPYVLGDTADGILDGRGCLTGDSALVQPYRVTIPVAGAYRFTARTTLMPPALDLVRPSGFPVALFEGALTSSAAQILAILPAGDYDIRPGSRLQQFSTGTYQLTSGPTTIPDGCSPSGLSAFAAPGVVINGTLSAGGGGDCTFNLNLGTTFNGSTIGDFYGLFVPPDQQIVVRMNALFFDALLLLATPNATQVITFNDNGGGGSNALVAFTAQQLGAPPGQGAYVWVVATSKGQTGAYTLSIEDPAGGAQAR